MQIWLLCLEVRYFAGDGDVFKRNISIFVASHCPTKKEAQKNPTIRYWTWEWTPLIKTRLDVLFNNACFGSNLEELSSQAKLDSQVTQWLGKKLMRSFCSPGLRSFRYLLISYSWKQEGEWIKNECSLYDYQNKALSHTWTGSQARLATWAFKPQVDSQPVVSQLLIYR